MRKIVRSIFTVCFLIIFIIGGTAQKSIKQSNQPFYGGKILIVNHRGANRLAPENTYASAKKGH